MLRLAVLVLILANVGYYGWSNGLLAPWGFAPHTEREPERLKQQIAPQSLQIVAPGGAVNAGQAQKPPTPPTAPAMAPVAPVPVPAGSADAPGSAGGTASAGSDGRVQAGVCLQAGPMNDARGAALRSALAVLPAGSWTLDPVEISGRWMVYMGRFADEETVARKRTELRALKVAFDRPGQAFEPGLALGRFSTEEAAQRGLADLTSNGIKPARVVQERAAEPRHLLRLPAATSAVRSQIAGLTINWGDTPLQPCR